MATKTPAVYILASQPHGTLYVGVTSDLVRRVWQHRQDLGEGFTRRHGAHALVYYELHAEMVDAIRREKQLKRWNRRWTIELIERENPRWDDVWLTLHGGQPEPVPRKGGPPRPRG